MCVYSMVMDHYRDKWNPLKELTKAPEYTPTAPLIPQADIDEFYKLLERAREYDKKNNEPDCELESKKEALTNLAKLLGVEIIFPEARRA